MISSEYIRVPLGPLSMSRSSTSSLAACVWIPLFPLRCEEARQGGLANYPTALLAPDTTRKLWQVSSLARHAGVKPGMTVSQAIGLCSSLRLIEPDPVHYDERAANLLSALSEVSPVVESAELGLAFVGTDGLEGIFGEPQKIIDAIRQTVRPSDRQTVRLGWGMGKFVAWVAASRSKPDNAVIVPVGGEKTFLASQPISALPLDPDTHRRLRQLGIRTLGALAALPEEAVTAQFGALGRRLWRLAAGRTVEPVVGGVAPEPIVAALTFFTPVGERDLIERAIDQLIARGLKDPRRIGWRVQAVRLAAELESWGGDEDGGRGAACCAPTNRSWLVTVLLKDPTAVAAARAGQQHALASAAREIRQRIKRTCLYHVIEVQPWSRLPERRYALID